LTPGAKDVDRIKKIIAKYCSIRVLGNVQIEEMGNSNGCK
jgi:hypothetical protein